MDFPCFSDNKSENPCFDLACAGVKRSDMAAPAARLTTAAASASAAAAAAAIPQQVAPPPAKAVIRFMLVPRNTPSSTQSPSRARCMSRNRGEVASARKAKAAALCSPAARPHPSRRAPSPAARGTRPAARSSLRRTSCTASPRRMKRAAGRSWPPRWLC